MLQPMRTAFLTLVAAATVVAFSSTTADAHFHLDAPPADNVQDTQGDPQKTAPCGGGTEPTGIISAYQVGTNVTITIDETIFPPGHYRVALAENDPSELPAEPPVTAGATECGSVPIEDPPVYPVLADGVLVHDAAFDRPRTIDVALPTDVTCDNCTLQVLEFMSSHAAPCFYHHCAAIKIQTDPVMTTTTTTTTSTTGSGGSSSGSGGQTGNGGAGMGNNGIGGEPTADLGNHDDSGCAAAPSRGANSGWFPLVAFAGLLAATRRRRSA